MKSWARTVVSSISAGTATPSSNSRRAAITPFMEFWSEVIRCLSVLSYRLLSFDQEDRKYGDQDGSGRRRATRRRGEESITPPWRSKVVKDGSIRTLRQWWCGGSGLRVNSHNQGSGCSATYKRNGSTKMARRTSIHPFSYVLITTIA